MNTCMMIDYRNDDGTFTRKEIDDFEFCVKAGFIYFISDGIKYKIPLDRCSQVYLN